MDGLSARVRSRRSRVRGDDSRRDVRGDSGLSFIRSLTPAAVASSRPRDPRVRRPPPPPPPWRATLLAAGVGRASRGCRIVGRGVDDARVTRRPRTDKPLRRRRRRLRRRGGRQPGRRPDARAVDVAALARACVAAAALCPPRAARRDEALASMLRDGKTGGGGRNKRVRAAAGAPRESSRDRREGRAVAVCQLMDCEERGEAVARREERAVERRGDGGSSSAVSSSGFRSAARPRWTLSDEGVRKRVDAVALHLSLTRVTPAKATSRRAARRPSSREALRARG